MKKRVFALISFILCLCFCLSGCNLFTENTVARANQIAVQAGSVTLTREELLKGYNNYYSTFYNNNSGNSEIAMEKLIEYLVSKKIYISDAEKLLDLGDIVITDTENNYIWYSVYSALINNIKTFEDKIKLELKIKDDEEDKDDLTQEKQFIYTPYDKIAGIVYNEEKGEYEISIIKNVLIEKTDEITGEKSYEYVPEDESNQYTLSELFDSEYIKNLINENKLFEGKIELTSEEEISKAISKEAIRRYFKQLKENEEGKNLSVDNESIFEREIDRIYKIIYENLLVNKLYVYKTSEINVSEEDVLNRYIEKVKASYERYLLDKKAFTTELTTTVGSAKYYAGYSTESNCIEDIFYVPQNEEENYFYLTHIVITLSPLQVQKINDLKQYCEQNGIDDVTYQIELNKIVDKSKIKLDERDKEGYVIIKSTDDDAISLDIMLTKLEEDLQEIDDKYGSSINSTNNLSEKDYYAYFNERADKFNEYIYKYSDDTGTLQIQNTIVGGKTNENWYVYGLGTGDTDAGFVKNFVTTARHLNSEGDTTAIETILMQNWDKTGDTEILKEQSTGYSTIMYCGKVVNLFECFDEKNFNLESLLSEESSNNQGKYYSLLKMDYQRLGLTMNKTLFDLVFEECYKDLYNNIIKAYEYSALGNVSVVTHENVYSDIIR